ncbi:MAG: phenylalanine--tRNA ligase subunit beta [Peptostreptococcaceae bacterium]|nr:phenylalanine--tRNA ligase subunit beta [Peptostreptococcaceae bacterium]
MLVSLEWIKDYTDINVNTTEFCDRMVMSGSNLETCTEFCSGIVGVVVGKIEKIEKHPEADKLVICQLNVGKDDLVQIVTGADNIFEGAIVPVALQNSRIPGPLHGAPKSEGGVKITKGKLRGVVSNGMLCSAGELGLDDKVVPIAHRDGIWIIEEEVKLGEDITTALGLNDSIIDFEITPNRPDCLSMIGMAREAAATFNTKLNYPKNDCKESDEKTQDYLEVEVKSDLCLRYSARVIKDVKIKQSPWWLQKRLIKAGMRPINNIVDITNFVMMEYGQPLHAFDIRGIEGNKIVVDVAKKGEKFTTLDEVERNLSENILMIYDAKKAVAIAGIMGGLDSGIMNDTTTVVIESATFNKDGIRKASKELAHRTEASGRYEKGIDPNLCEEAADRVCHLVELTESGTVLKGSVDVYPNKYVSAPVEVRVDRVNKVLGIEVERKFMTDVFESLEMKVSGDGNIMTVTPPTIRQDLIIEEDFIEEVARMYGYENLPTTLPKSNTVSGESEHRKLRNIAREALCSMGFNEIQTYSFVSPRGIDKINIDEDSWERAFVELINPLGDENSVMRTILTPNMMEVLSRNYSRKIGKVSAFEIGNTFIKNFIDPNGLPDENYSICLGMYGDDVDFFSLKGATKELLSLLGIEKLSFISEKEYGVYHPGRCARIVAHTKDEDVEIGIMGEIHPDVMENYGIGQRVYVCELMFETINEISDREIVFSQLPKYPSTSRDIALLVEENLEVAKIEETIREASTEILESLKMFDIYKGKQVADGKKSVAYSLTYRHKDKTLTDADVDKVHENILKALESKLNATLRDM